VVAVVSFAHWGSERAQCANGGLTWISAFFKVLVASQSLRYIGCFRDSGVVLSARQLALSKLVSFWQRFLGHYEKNDTWHRTRFQTPQPLFEVLRHVTSPYSNLRSLCVSQCNSTPLNGTSSSFRCTLVLRNARDRRGLQYLVECTEFGIAIFATHGTIS
jgi:hypothetical protein